MVEADGEIEISTDRRALKQILTNLTSNAIKFTDNGVVALKLSQRRDEVGWVAVLATPAAGSRGRTRTGCSTRSLGSASRHGLRAPGSACTPPRRSPLYSVA